MTQTMILYLILGLRPHWQPSTCDRVFASESNEAHCRRVQESGYSKAAQYAEWMLEEAERFGIPAELMPIVAYREQSLEFEDQCQVVLRADRITSRELQDEDAGRWTFCWQHGGGQTCQPALLISEDTDAKTVTVNRCAHGEIGGYQLMMREIPANYELPWGGTTGRSTRDRRLAALDARTNIHLGARTFAEGMVTCCGDNQECRADWSRWIGYHNTGSCRGDAFARYAVRLRGHLTTAIAYACTQDPTLSFCPQE